MWRRNKREWEMSARRLQSTNIRILNLSPTLRIFQLTAKNNRGSIEPVYRLHCLFQSLPTKLYISTAGCTRTLESTVWDLAMKRWLAWKGFEVYMNERRKGCNAELNCYAVFLYFYIQNNNRDGLSEHWLIRILIKDKKFDTENQWSWVAGKNNHLNITR